MQQKVHNDIRDVFNMPTRSDAEIQLKKLIEKYGKTAPDLSSWLRTNCRKALQYSMWNRIH